VEVVVAEPVRGEKKGERKGNTSTSKRKGTRRRRKYGGERCEKEH